MSWSWKNMDEDEEEVKEYDVKGSVTISTQEYKDLIAKVYKLKQMGQREHDDWYNTYNKCSDLEKQLKSAQANVEKYSAYINSSEIRKADYVGWDREKRLEELNKDDEI